MQIKAVMCAGVAQYHIPLLDRKNGWGEDDGFYLQVSVTHKDWTTDSHDRSRDGLAELYGPTFMRQPLNAQDLATMAGNLLQASTFLRNIPESYCSSNMNQPIPLMIDPLNIPEVIQ